eukprot:TRINITY_DN256_c1_g1_i1.p1 TRINITY_DN256_c1_g1~~TRINITY_DN256_c1_g1_i1.p1  ORF type:complete len:393 (+),score=124.23 TRINITY_DN256_c1_g1_i1:96-1181(+)
MAPPAILAKRAVEELRPYVAPLEGRRNMLRLDFNENTVGPSPRVVEAIRRLPPEAYATYPEYEGLTRKFANYVGVPSDRVGLFNGVDAAIRAIFDAYGAPGEVFLQTTPTFAYYQPCAMLQSMVIETIPYSDDLSYPHAAVLKRLRSNAPPRILFVCNPNNPTGTLMPAEQIVALAEASPGTLVVADELYQDFTGVSVLPGGLRLPNLVCLRSMSKTQGIAALRLGFVVAHPEILSRLVRVTGPYDVNMFGVVAATAAMDDRAHTEAYVAEVLRAKKWIVAALRERGMRVHSDGGNMVLVWPPAGKPAAVCEAALRREGVLVRSMRGKPLIGESFRLSIGTMEQMRQFLDAFTRVLAAPKL